MNKILAYFINTPIRVLTDTPLLEIINLVNELFILNFYILLRVSSNLYNINLTTPHP